MRRLPALLLGALLLVTACGSAPGAAATPTPRSEATPAPASRPASSATVRIVQPVDGAVIHGTTMHVAVQVAGATIVQTTTTHIQPDQGHVHLYLDNSLVYMAYSLQQDFPVHPGTYVLKAEFVASDHFPFNPRVWSPQIIVTVQ